MRITSLPSVQRPSHEVTGTAGRSESTPVRAAEPAAESALSDEARLVALAQRGMASAAAARTGQVLLLRRAVQAGTYAPDASRVSASLCATVISGGT